MAETVISYARIKDPKPVFGPFEYLLLIASRDIDPFAHLVDELRVPNIRIRADYHGKSILYHQTFPLTEMEMCRIGSIYKSQGYLLNYLGEISADSSQQAENR